VSITVNAEPNTSPVANAGADATYTVPHDGIPSATTGELQVTLDGSQSVDPDGDTVAYWWTCGGVRVADGKIAHTTFKAGTHSCVLTAKDSYGSTTGDTVIITMNAEPNGTPVANAGADKTVSALDASHPIWTHYQEWTSVENVVLDGSASTDPDGDTLVYSWNCGNNHKASGPKRAISLPAGSHTCTLTVEDTYGATATDSATITVS